MTTKRRSPQLFQVDIAPAAIRDFEHLPARAALAAHAFLRTVMREQPERYGLRLRGDLKGLLLARRANFQVTYRVDHGTHRVFVLRIELR